jgi:hypothetical protein
MVEMRGSRPGLIPAPQFPRTATYRAIGRQPQRYSCPLYQNSRAVPLVSVHHGERAHRPYHVMSIR